MITVIIPAYNAEKTIEMTLRALQDQTYRGKFETIVVDDGSKDRTPEIVRGFKDVKLLQQPNAGPAKARNHGAREAKGDIIIFTDSDCVPECDFIEKMAEPFTDPTIAGVSGTYRTLNKEHLIARFEGYEIAQRHDRMARMETIDFIGTAYAGYRRDVFLKFGGFNETFRTASGEDPELSYRISKAGHKLVFQPTAVVAHPHVEKLKKYLRQKYYRAYWRNFMYWGGHKDKLSGDSYTSKTLFPQAVLSGLIPLLIFAGTIVGMFTVVEMVAYAAASLFVIAFLLNLDLYWFIWKREKKVALVSPFIITLRNFVVVFGTLHGLVKFMGSRK